MFSMMQIFYFMQRFKLKGKMEYLRILTVDTTAERFKIKSLKTTKDEVTTDV